MRDQKRYTVQVQADSSGEWVGNGLSFNHVRQAYDYATDLMWRWTAVRAWRIWDTQDQMERGSSLDLSFIPPAAIHGFEAGDEVTIQHGQWQGERWRVKNVYDQGDGLVELQRRASLPDGEWVDFCSISGLELGLIKRIPS